MSSGIFQKQRHRLSMGGKLQGRFDSEGLEQAVKNILDKQGLDKDDLMLEELDNKCNVYVPPYILIGISAILETVC
jgi:hypothetical protein